MSAFPKVFAVSFWRDGCTPVSTGCDNCLCHGPGLLPSRDGHASARLAKINDHSFAIGGTPHLILVQDDCDLWADNVDPADYKTLVNAVEAAQAADLVISTRYIRSMHHRAPAHWLEGRWPANLGLMVSVSNQAEAERDIPVLLAAKLKFDIPWVGARLEPLIGGISLRKLTLQALAHPMRRGRQWLDALTGDVQGVTGEKYRPKTPFGTLDWVTVAGEHGKDARPLHPLWLKALAYDCTAANVLLHFRGWGEWLPVNQVMNHHAPDLNPARAQRDRMFMYRNGTTECDSYDMLMEFVRFGAAESGAFFNGQILHAIPTFPRRSGRSAA